MSSKVKKGPRGCQISDEEILRLIRLGLIVLRSGDLYKFHNKRRRFYKIKGRTHGSNGSSRIICKINLKHKQRGISRGKLVWMVANKSLVPEGYDIDHRDQNNTNDDPSNLRLRESADNRRDNFSSGYRETEDYFNKIIARRHRSAGDF